MGESQRRQLRPRRAHPQGHRGTARRSYAEGRAKRRAALAEKAHALIARLRVANPLNAANLARAIHLLIRDAAFEADEPDSRTDSRPRSPEAFDPEVEPVLNNHQA